MIDDNNIDYGKLIDDAMHAIVKRVLEDAAKNGLPGNHHFFISFLTNHPKTSISEALKERYPEEMTIVLQHQFENLQVKDDYFSVVLSFDNVKETITIPFKSLTAFADPSVKFGLQFQHLLQLDDKDLFTEKQVDEEVNFLTEISEIEPKTKNNKKTAKKPIKKKKNSTKKSSNVVSIEKFRKK